MNKAPIEVSVKIPYPMSMMLGGISIPSVPAALMQPVAKESSYLYRRIAGIHIGPIVATAVTLPPETAPKPAQATTEDIAKPPGNLPSQR